MKTAKYALAAALGLIALVAPRAVRADDIADFSINLTYTGLSVCGSSGTSLCSETSTVSFEWDNSTNSYVSGSATVTGSGALGSMTLYSPPSNASSSGGPLVSLITSDTEGDLVYIDIGETAGGSLPVGSYTTVSVDPPPTMNVTAYLVCGSYGDSCEFDYTGSATGVYPIIEVAAFGTGTATVQAASASVPEPPTGIMLAIGLLCLTGMTLLRKSMA